MFPFPYRPAAVDPEQIRKLGLRQPQLTSDPFELKWGQLPSLPDKRYACLFSLIPQQMGLVRAPYFIVAHPPTPVPQAQQTPNCAVRSPCLRLPLKNRPVSVLNVESPRAASRSPHQNAVASVQNFVTHHAAVTMLSALMPIVRLKNWLGSLHFSSLSWWPQSALLLPQPRLTWRGWCRVGGVAIRKP